MGLMSKIKLSVGLVLPESSRGETLLAFANFWGPQALVSSRPLPPSSKPAWRIVTTHCAHVPPVCKAPVITLHTPGCSRLLPISRSLTESYLQCPFLPCKVTHSQGLGLEGRHLGAIIQSSVGASQAAKL